ncbi:MAG: TlpA family protein disulfide reductase [Deltaproteobacteria bacterium]|nr:TlpA family protein disulfide reductase [Deltaproteobacteria bacterium]
MSASATSGAPRTGLSIALLMLAAFAIVGGRMIEVARGPRPPGPGDAAPALEGTGLADEPSGLSRFRGKVVLVDFWATWCPPCVEMLPTLERVHGDYGARGFTVLGVNQEPDERAHVEAFLKRRGITFPQLLDPGTRASSYGVFSFPSSFLIGRDGRIVAAHRGPTREATLRKEIEAALTETSSPAASARR